MGVGVIVFIGLLVIAGLWILIMPASQTPPKLQDAYWGPGDEPKTLDNSIRPFKIKFSQDMINDLRQRLRATRKFQPPLEDVGWTYGVNSDYMPAIVDYWLNKYDFNKREEHLNRYPQFLTNIQGLDIHFIHVKPKLPNNRKIDVLPLYIQHGWPGSVVEFYKIIPLLTTVRDDRDFVFEVVAPSLPGFGYSTAASKAGLGPVEIAHIMKNLMLRLGFDKWYTQGGDWGAAITANMASMYPQHILGLHSNFCLVLRPLTWLKIYAYSYVPRLLPDDEREKMFPLETELAKLISETGYMHLQATKPDTLGIGMTDSPAGLAAYIFEKFSSATNYKNLHYNDGGLLHKFTMDELIDNLMFYWVPNKVTSSFRIYAEFFSRNSFRYKMDNVPIEVPSACAQFPHEITFQSSVFLRDRFLNLIRVSKPPKGGHFAAMEEPQLLADDVWAAVQEFRDFYSEEEKLRLESEESSDL